MELLVVAKSNNRFALCLQRPRDGVPLPRSDHCNSWHSGEHVESRECHFEQTHWVPWTGHLQLHKGMCLPYTLHWSTIRIYVYTSTLFIPISIINRSFADHRFLRCIHTPSIQPLKNSHHAMQTTDEKPVLMIRYVALTLIKTLSSSLEVWQFDKTCSRTTDYGWVILKKVDEDGRSFEIRLPTIKQYSLKSKLLSVQPQKPQTNHKNRRQL